MVNAIPLLQPIAPETWEKMKQVPGNKVQHPVAPEPEKEEESANLPQVMQIIKSVRHVPRTPQEILAAFNNKKSKQTTYRPSGKPLPPVRKPSPVTAEIQPPLAQKSKSPLKALPTPLATPIEGCLTLQAPEVAVQQPVNSPPLVCPICGEQFHFPYKCPFLASNGPRVTQRVQELHKEGETNPIRSTEGHQLKECNPETATGKRRIFNPSVSPELQSGRLLSPPSIVKSYRSEITVQSPGEGSSSPPSPAHGVSYGENDAAGLLLELSAKNIVASLVPLPPAPIPTRPSAEIDETSSEGAKVEREISEDDERQVVPSVGGQARRKSSESYWSKSSSDPPSTKGKPSPNSRPTTLPTPPIVQSASLIRPQSSPPPTVDLSLEVLESPVIEKHKSLIPHNISIEQGDVTRDEELKPTRILHHVCCFLKHVNHVDLLKAAETPSPLLHKLRPSQSLPRLSVISRKFPRTVVPLLLPKSTSLYTPTMPNPNLDDSEDIMSSDDDSSDTDDQNSTQIPTNQQAGSRPVRRRHRNVLATF